MRRVDGVISECSEKHGLLDLSLERARERQRQGWAAVLATLSDNPGLAAANLQTLNHLPGSDVVEVTSWHFRLNGVWCRAAVDPRRLPGGPKQVVVTEDEDGPIALAIMDREQGQVLVSDRCHAGFGAQALAHLKISFFLTLFAYLVAAGMLLLGLSGSDGPFPWNLLAFIAALMPVVCLALWLLVTYREWPTWRQATAIFRCLGLRKPSFVDLDRASASYYRKRGTSRPRVFDLYRLPDPEL